MIVGRARAAGRLPFIGGHPLAGRRRRGVEAARPDLFDDRPWLLTPAASGDDAALDALDGVRHRARRQSRA